jgi:hypothetical protein
VRSASRPTPNLEDQASVFISPGDRVAQLYPWTLGSSVTSGSPFPLTTYVGPWGARIFKYFKITDIQISQVAKELSPASVRLWRV